MECLIALDRILDESNEFGQWTILKKDLFEIRNAMKKFIRQEADLAEAFLKWNK